MKKIGFVLSLLGLMVVYGCAQKPRTELTSWASQQKVLTAEHWQDLAEFTAKELDDYLTSTDEKRVFLQPNATDSAFNRAFHKYLSESLLESGYAIAKQPAGATVVNFGAETFLYSDDTKEQWPFNRATFWATLYSFSDTILDSGSGEITDLISDALAISLGATYDYLEARNQVTDAEVVVTTSIQSIDEINFLKNTEFYIDRNDLILYWSDKPLEPPRLNGRQTDQALPLTRLNLVK